MMMIGIDDNDGNDYERGYEQGYFDAGRNSDLTSVVVEVYIPDHPVHTMEPTLRIAGGTTIKPGFYRITQL